MKVEFSQYLRCSYCATFSTLQKSCKKCHENIARHFRINHNIGKKFQFTFSFYTREDQCRYLQLDEMTNEWMSFYRRPMRKK